MFTGRTYCNATWDGWGCWNYTVVCVYRSHLLQRHLGRMGMLELHGCLCLQVAPTATPPGTDGDVGTTQSLEAEPTSIVPDISMASIRNVSILAAA